MGTKEYREKLREALMGAKAIVDPAAEADRELTAEEREKVKAYIDDAAAWKKKLKAAEDDEALLGQIREMGFDLLNPQADGRAPGAPAKAMSIGAQFVESDGYKRWIKELAPNGHISDKTKGIRSPAIQLKTLLTGESPTSAGAFVRPDVTGIYEPLGRRRLTVRDLITNAETESDIVSFVRETAQVTQAAVVGEATATSGVSGTKPEGTMTYENVEMPVKTVAVWIPATKRALSDVAQLRSLIDASLQANLDEHLEDQMVAGAGSATDGDDFVGIMNTSGVLEQAWDTDTLTTMRKARTTLQTTGLSYPTGILCHPNDAEALDLLKDDYGRFYFGGPADGGAQRVWRVPLLECDAVTEGTSIMGDFRKAYLWDRHDGNISVSDSHSDFFIRNMVAVLAEIRAAFALIRPSAFILVPMKATS